MHATDWSLTVCQRKLACVLDPSLVLGFRDGPALALRLTRVFEPWLTRSFWQVIDASDLLMHRHGLGPRALPPGLADGLQPDAQALATWVAMRDHTDAGSWTLRWMGDCLAESQVRDGADAGVVDRYEELAAALAQRVQRDERGLAGLGLDPVSTALDTLALSACLDGALVLTPTQPAEADDPWPVRALARAGLHATRLDPIPADALFAAERQWVRDALVSAGLSTVALRLPPLAVVHVLADGPSAGAGDGEATSDPWDEAQAWWYRV